MYKKRKRKIYGGNSGYINYSQSKRGYEAEMNGIYPKTYFKQYYHISEKLFMILLNKSIINTNEWHHTGIYGRQTDYCKWTKEEYKELYKNNKDLIKSNIRKNNFNILDIIFK